MKMAGSLFANANANANANALSHPSISRWGD
jgi:hypothetical protein